MATETLYKVTGPNGEAIHGGEAMSAMPLRLRLEARVQRTPSGCLEWQGARSAGGYGQIGIGGKVLYTHRVAYELAHGPLPSGAHVLHSCDNPPCMELMHLSVGDAAKNKADCEAKGRGNHLHANRARGERHHAAKLSAAEAQAIRSSSLSTKELVRQYNVARNTTQRIRRGETWRCLWHPR